MIDVDKRHIFPGLAMHASGCRQVPIWASYVRNSGVFTPDVVVHHSYVRTTRAITVHPKGRFSYVRSTASTTVSSVTISHATTSKSRLGSAFLSTISINLVYLAHLELISEFSYVRKSDNTPLLNQSSYVRSHIDVPTSTCVSYVRTGATSVASHNEEHSYVRNLIQPITFRSPHHYLLFAKRTSASQACHMDMPPPGTRKVRHRYRLILIEPPKPPRNPRGFLLPDQKFHFARLGHPGSDGRSHFGDEK